MNKKKNHQISSLFNKYLIFDINLIFNKIFVITNLSALLKATLLGLRLTNSY